MPGVDPAALARVKVRLPVAVGGARHAGGRYICLLLQILRMVVGAVRVVRRRTRRVGVVRGQVDVLLRWHGCVMDRAVRQGMGKLVLRAEVCNFCVTG